MFALKEKLHKLKFQTLDPELSAKLEKVQELLGDICVSTHTKIKKIRADYRFLSRDHVFFDGDNNHSGAV